MPRREPRHAGHGTSLSSRLRAGAGARVGAGLQPARAAVAGLFIAQLTADLADEGRSLVAVPPDKPGAKCAEDGEEACADP
jgi:hypothetical protein